MLYKCKIRLSFFEALILNCFCLKSQETAIIEDHPDLKKHRTRLGQLRDDPDYRQKEKEYQAEKTTCECGSILRWGGYAKHKRSKSHQQRMNSIQLIQLIFILPSLDNNMKRMNPSRAESHVRRHCVML